MPLRFLVLGLLLGLTACSSIISRGVTATEADKGISYNGIYPGVRFSYDMFFRPSAFGKSHLREFGESPPIVKGPVFVFVGLPDIPFSLALDTLFLPFDFLFWLTQPAPEQEEDTAESTET